MKRLLLLIVLITLSQLVVAQLEVKKDSFKEVPGFVNINPDPNYQYDDNDLPFAVIKVRTENINNKQRRELKFSGNAGTFIMLEYKDGEVWVYLTAKYADFLKISHPDLSSTEYYFPFDLKPKLGYELTLVNILPPQNDITVDIINNDLLFNVKGVCFLMKNVDGGSFNMGAQCSNPSGMNYIKDAYGDTGPVHNVFLDNYFIGETEVTQKLWKVIVGQNPSLHEGDNMPVERVSWEACQDFINKLNELTGYKFRLPTEAEWEYAARGGNKSKGYKYSGSNNIDEVAWYDANSDDKSHMVKTKSPNELGIYDMSGNVYEWCYDWYGSYDDIITQKNPRGLQYGKERILRGGEYSYIEEACLISNRLSKNPKGASKAFGFRLALSMENENNSQAFQIVTNSDFSISITYNGVDFIMKYIKGGSFKMGNDSNKPEIDQIPVHDVILNDYYICETEITQALWCSIMDSNPSYLKGDDLPVDYVSWEACQDFINKLNELTGYKFRLPTEAEWEYAARGGNKSKGYKYSGSNNIDEVAWYWKNSGNIYITGTDDDWNYDVVLNNNCKIHPVKTKKPNELGLYDMSGNVWEWCSDYYDEFYYKNSPLNNPTGPSTGTYGKCHVQRGGNYKYYSEYCCVYYRDTYVPNFRLEPCGFRLVLSK